MPATLNHNVNLQHINRNMQIHFGNTGTQIEKASSGMRINRSSDDPASMALANGIHSDIYVMAEGSRNVQQSIQMLQVAEGALSQITEMIQRMGSLATQSASSTYSDANRPGVNAEFQALKNEIDRIAEFTTYNGMHLLDSVDEYTIQAGASEASNDVLRIAIGDMRAMGPELNLDPVTADTLENSQDAIDRLEMARLNLTSKRNHIAALHNRLELSVETAASITASMLATESNVRSADFAQTLSSLTNSQIMMQTAASLAYEADIDVDRILSLLQQ
jgi:flagellin|tara:strand:- start:808 stop:1638 length:831 start_codon:yes stop_codon:yes gene_type:complete